MRQVSVVEARALLEGPAPPQLVDCREPFEWRIARLPGALLIPLGETLDRAHELDPDRPVLVYCHHGVRSINAAMLLERAGFTALSMRGGIDQWSVKVDPTIPRY